MKNDCNVNMKELTNIVDGMLAEKNQLGRHAFNMMKDEQPSAGEEIDENHPVDYHEQPDYQMLFESLFDDMLVLVQDFIELGETGSEGTPESDMRVKAIAQSGEEMKSILQKYDHMYGQAGHDLK